jgi:hypothetical protein
MENQPEMKTKQLTQTMAKDTDKYWAKDFTGS